jgi:hypothetical protein
VISRSAETNSVEREISIPRVFGEQRVLAGSQAVISMHHLQRKDITGGNEDIEYMQFIEKGILGSVHKVSRAYLKCERTF